MNKKISIIMGIYNCATTLAEAIDSIINQTYTNWELIMCEDGSKDNTKEVAEEYVNKYPDKIKLIQNEENMGLNYTLNRCLEHSTGDYIARMDGDDISLPHRFETEIKVLEENPDITIVSSSMILFDENGEWGKIVHKAEPKGSDFVYKNQICHAPCMVRKEAYIAVGGYTVDEKLLRVEDYHLWIKMYSKGYKAFNIEEPLYKMRDGQEALKRRTFRSSIYSMKTQWRIFSNLGLPWLCRFKALRGPVVAMLPKFLYVFLHKMKQKA